VALGALAHASGHGALLDPSPLTAALNHLIAIAHTPIHWPVISQGLGSVTEVLAGGAAMAVIPKLSLASHTGRKSFKLSTLRDSPIDHEKLADINPLLEQAKAVILTIPDLPAHVQMRIRNTSLFISNQIPAMAEVILDETHPTILLHSSVARKLSRTQLLSTLGHELGHVLLADAQWAAQRQLDQKSFLEVRRELEDRCDLLGLFVVQQLYPLTPLDWILKKFDVYASLKNIPTWPWGEEEPWNDPHRADADRRLWIKAQQTGPFIYSVVAPWSFPINSQGEQEPPESTGNFLLPSRSPSFLADALLTLYAFGLSGFQRDKVPQKLAALRRGRAPAVFAAIIEVFIFWLVVSLIILGLADLGGSPFILQGAAQSAVHPGLPGLSGFPLLGSAVIGRLKFYSRRDFFGIAGGTVGGLMLSAGSELSAQSSQAVRGRTGADASAIFDRIFSASSGLEDFIAAHAELAEALRRHQAASPAQRRQYAVAYALYVLLQDGGVAGFRLSKSGREFETRFGDWVMRYVRHLKWTDVGMAFISGMAAVIHRKLDQAGQALSAELQKEGDPLRVFLQKPSPEQPLTPLAAYAMLGGMLRFTGMTGRNEVSLVMDTDKRLLLKIAMPGQSPVYIHLDEGSSSFGLPAVEARELTPEAVRQYDLARPYLGQIDASRGINQITDKKIRGIVEDAAPILTDLEFLGTVAPTLTELLLRPAAPLLGLSGQDQSLLRTLTLLHNHLADRSPESELLAAALMPSEWLPGEPENPPSAGVGNARESSGSQGISDSLKRFAHKPSVELEVSASLQITALEHWLKNPEIQRLRQRLNALGPEAAARQTRYQNMLNSLQEISKRLSEAAKRDDLRERLLRQRVNGFKSQALLSTPPSAQPPEPDGGGTAASIASYWFARFFERMQAARTPSETLVPGAKFSLTQDLLDKINEFFPGLSITEAELVSILHDLAASGQRVTPADVYERMTRYQVLIRNLQNHSGEWYFWFRIPEDAKLYRGLGQEKWDGQEWSKTPDEAAKTVLDIALRGQRLNKFKYVPTSPTPRVAWRQGFAPLDGIFIVMNSKAFNDLAQRGKAIVTHGGIILFEGDELALQEDIPPELIEKIIVSQNIYRALRKRLRHTSYSRQQKKTLTEKVVSFNPKPDEPHRPKGILSWQRNQPNPEWHQDTYLESFIEQAIGRDVYRSHGDKQVFARRSLIWNIQKLVGEGNEKFLSFMRENIGARLSFKVDSFERNDPEQVEAQLEKIMRSLTENRASVGPEQPPTPKEGQSASNTGDGNSASFGPKQPPAVKRYDRRFLNAGAYLWAWVVRVVAYWDFAGGWRLWRLHRPEIFAATRKALRAAA